MQIPIGPKAHHVVPNLGGGWDVKRGGAGRASSHQELKREAVVAGRALSRRQGTEFHIHNKDEGRIARSDSHGGNPFPPEG